MDEPRLTPRERAVLALIAGGRTNAQVAHALGVGFETAKTYANRIRAKLGIAGAIPGRRSAEYAAWARRLGIPLPRTDHVDAVARSA